MQVKQLTMTTSVIQLHSIISYQKSKTKTLYHNPDHNFWNKAYKLGRAGKAGGRNSNWFNVKDLNKINI